jgi:protein phosphatase PTC7
VFDVAVAPGDIVILGSDGLFDNVFDEEIASVATAAVASVRGAGALSAARAVSEALAVGGYLFVYMTPRHATHAHVLIKFHTSRRGCPVFPASSR